MADEQTRDHWSEFINEPLKKQEGRALQPNDAILSSLASFQLPSTKKQQAVEKVHPFIQIANEKKTKTGLQAEHFISQRNRCKNYEEIRAEEELARTKKQIEKDLKKLNGKESKKGRQIAVPRRQRPKQDRNSSDNEHEESLQLKKACKNGPPYMPNVLTMGELYKKSPKDNQPKKLKQKKPVRSRSRSKTYKRQAAKNQYDTESDRIESSPERVAEPVRGQNQLNGEVEKETSKRIVSPVDRLTEKSEEISQSASYMFSSHSMKKERLPQPTKQPIPNTNEAQLQKEQLPILPKNHKLKIDQSLPTQRCEEANVKYEKTYDDQVRYNEQLQERLRVIEEQLKRKHIEEENAELNRQIKIKEKALLESSQSKHTTQRHAEAKHRHYEQDFKRHHKRKSKSPSHRSSTNSFHEENNWKKQLRKVTGYNPHDAKYRMRDRIDIRESGYSQMTQEQIKSYRLGRKEEEADERYNQKMFKKRHY